MFAEPRDDEQIIERVAALDIGKAEIVCCIRLPAADGERRVAGGFHALGCSRPCGKTPGRCPDRVRANKGLHQVIRRQPHNRAAWPVGPAASGAAAGPGS